MHRFVLLFAGFNVTSEHIHILPNCYFVNACDQPAQNPLSFTLISKNVQIKIYRNIILIIVFYGCETWSLTLREEYRLRVFENRVLRRKFGPERDEVTGKWRRLHNEELHALYSLPNTFRVIKSRLMDREFSTYG